MTAAINYHLDDPGPEGGDAIPDGVGGPLGHREVDHQLLGALLPLRIPGHQNQNINIETRHINICQDLSSFAYLTSPLAR